jgi:hypothetical protein
MASQRRLLSSAKASAMSILAKPKLVIFFKPVPGGFVYAAPKPWLFGRTNYYLVTEAQKDEITAAIQLRSLTAMFLTPMAVMILGLGAAMAFIWFRHSYRFVELTSGDTAIILVAAVLSMMLAFRIAFRSLTKRLRPLLATLPRSDVGVTREDARRAVLSTNSAKQLWLQVALSAFAAAMSLWFIVLPLKHVRAALSGDPISIVFLLGMCVIMWGLIAQIRLAIEKTMQESKCP